MSPRPPSGDARRRLFVHAHDWFGRARAALLETLPCRQGCTRCCQGPFGITLLDQLELQQGLQKLPHQVRHDIQTRAQSQASTVEGAFPRLAELPYIDTWNDRELDNLVTRFNELPCPALGNDGSCLVYAHRPITCRLMGLPVEADGITQEACDIQTFVPIIRVSKALRDEEERLAEEEAKLIAEQRDVASTDGEEILLPYGFLSPSAA